MGRIRIIKSKTTKRIRKSKNNKIKCASCGKTL